VENAFLFARTEIKGPVYFGIAPQKGFVSHTIQRPLWRAIAAGIGVSIHSLSYVLCYVPDELFSREPSAARER
jgi:hypothetical protein